MKQLPRQNAFTLIELVLVIIILAIVSVAITGFFRNTTEGYLQSESRIGMSSSARIAAEKIGREIREAMPNSVRVNGIGNCVEFVPILEATRYISLPTTAPGTILTVVEADASTNISGLNISNLYVMVIPLNTNEVYNATSGHFAQVTGFSKLGANQTQVIISSARFNRQSPENRIFFVSQPTSFCVTGNELRRYTNYGFNVTQPSVASMGVGDLVLNRLLTSSGGISFNVFDYEPGTLNRSGLLLIEFLIEGRDESIRLEHEVHVRNFP